MRDQKPNDPKATRLKERLNRLTSKFEAIVEKSLWVVVNGALQKLPIKAEVDYVDRLTDDLLTLSTEPMTGIDERVEELLWQYNFNSRAYFLHYIKRIGNKVQAEETLLGKLELLAFELKKVNQRVSEEGLRYTTTYSSLQDVVGSWLSEEIAFLRTKQQLTITFVHPDKALSQDFKIALDLSIAQFSCLVRGLMEKKLILNTNITELAGFLSGVVITKRSENISVGSFRKKYYNVEEGTKKSVIDMLNKVIDWLLRN